MILLFLELRTLNPDLEKEKTRTANPQKLYKFPANSTKNTPVET